MNSSIIVADVGNSRIHLGEFCLDSKSERDFVPGRTFNLPCESLDFDLLHDWLAEANSPCAWRIGSVNQPVCEQFISWLNDRKQSCHLVTYKDVPMPILVEHPETVGIDRLAAALAANQLRPSHQPAIIIDAGTAITIDCVSVNGEFLGGSIAPGLDLGLQSLHQKTDQIPLTNMSASPALIGKNTTQAIQSGVYWLTIGGIESLVGRLETELAGPCTVFATGGAMPLLVSKLNFEPQSMPHLVLSGLAMTYS